MCVGLEVDGRKISECVQRDVFNYDLPYRKSYRCSDFHGSLCDFCHGLVKDTCLQTKKCGWCETNTGKSLCLEGFSADPFYPVDWNRSTTCVSWEYNDAPNPTTPTSSTSSSTTSTTSSATSATSSSTKSSTIAPTNATAPEPILPDYGPTSFVGIAGILIGFLLGGVVGFAVIGTCCYAMKKGSNDTVLISQYEGTYRRKRKGEDSVN